MADGIRVRVGQNERTFSDSESPITIGSGPGVAMASANPKVAGRHATIEASGSRWSVIAAPGAALYLAGQQVPKASVGGGVQLMLGDPETGEELTVAVGSAAMPPSRIQARPTPANVPTAEERTPAQSPLTGPKPPHASPPPTAATAPGGGRAGGVHNAATSAATVGVGVGGVNLKIHHNGLEKEFPPGRVVTIGRRSSNDIELNNPLISANHAQVRFGATGWELDDQGSTHGIWYDGQRVTHLELSGVTTVSFAEEGNGERVMFVAPGETRTPPKTAGPGGSSRTPLLIGVGALAVVALAVALFVALRKPEQITTTPGSGDPGSVRAQLPPPEKNFDQATLAKGTVKLETDDSIGSGTIISEDGLILTNAHVAAPSLLGDGPDPKALLVYVNENGDARAVEPKFIARTVAADGKRDLAVVRIEETIGHNKVTAEQLRALTSIPVGKNAPPGTEIEILGFPGVAKSGSVTFTRGLVSSYAPGPAGENQYANTDAKVEHGNSGGLAADKAGTIVGVPTRIYCPLEKDRTGKTVQNCVSAEGGGTQNELTAIDMAAPLIAAAKGNTSYRVAG